MIDIKLILNNEYNKIEDWWFLNMIDINLIMNNEYNWWIYDDMNMNKLIE